MKGEYMTKIESIIRGANPWYNVENVYCLLRLIQENESKGIIILHDELDAFQEKILSEIELDVKNVVPLKMHLNHLGGAIIFNSSEDFYLIKEVYERPSLLDATPAEILEVAKFFVNEFEEFTYQMDLYMLYSDIKKLIESVEELEVSETEPNPMEVQTERKVIRH